MPDSEETVPIHFDNVECAGDEKGIVNCERSTTENCNHSEDTGIICGEDNSC